MDLKEAAQMTSGLRSLFQSGLFSDLTLICGDREVKVHKLILYPQSDVFNRMLGPGFREATTSSITLDDDPDALNCLLNYLYKNYYEQGIPATANRLLLTIEVYAIADKYAVPRLRKLATNNLERLLDPEDDLDNYLAAIRLADEKSSSMESELWGVVIDNVRENMEFLKSQEKFAALLFELPGLMIKLLGFVTSPDEVGQDEDESHGGGWSDGRRLGWG